MKKYKIIAVGMSALLTACCLPIKDINEFFMVNAQTASDDSVSYEQNNTYTSDSYSFNSTTGTLTISGSGDMTDYSTSSEVPWYSYKDEIKNVIIQDGITSIGYASFYECKNLESVQLPASLEKISNSAFYRCSKLSSVTFPDTLKSIGNSAFEECSSLTSLEIPDSVTSIGKSAFESCSGLISIKLSENITKISENMLYECKGLTSLNIPDGVTSVEQYALRDCTSMTDITIPESVTYFGYGAFWDNAWLDAKKQENPFVIVNNILIDASECTGNVSIPENVKTIGVGAFYFNENVTSVEMSDNVKKIEESAFYYCTALESINLSDSIESIERWAFRQCHKLVLDKIPNSVSSMSGNLIFENCYNITSMKLPVSLKSIGSFMFKDCNALKEVTISKNTTNIGQGAFGTCSNLTDVYYQGTEEEWQNIYISSANNCLDNAVIHYNSDAYDSDYYNGKYGENCTYTFDSATGTLTISGSGNMMRYDGEAYPWQSYKNDIKKVIIENGVESISAYAFSQCRNLISIDISETVSSIDNNLSNWIENCPNLTEFNVSENNLYFSSSDGVLFDKSKSTLIKCPENYQKTEYIIPNEVKTINMGAFLDCNNLTSVILSNNITEIASLTFYNCAGLTSVTIPDSVTSIWYSAFNYCNKLTDVYYLGTEKEWNSIEIGSDNECLTNAAIHYNLSESENSFEWNKNNWSFTNSTEYFNNKQTWYIEDNDLEKLLSRCNNNEKIGIQKKLKKNSYWDGSCVGLSILSVLNTQNIFNTNEYFENTSCLYDLPAPNHDSLESMITYYHLAQKLDAFNQKKNETAYLTESEKLTEIISQLTESNEPIILLYSQKSFGGHAVVAYGVEEGSWIKNNTRYSGRILIYDNLNYDFNDDYCLYYSADLTKWTIPAYPSVNTSNNAAIRLYSNESEIINNISYFDDTSAETSFGNNYIADLNTNAHDSDFSLSKISSNNGDFGIGSALKDDEIRIDYDYSAGTSSYDYYDILLKDGKSGYMYKIDSEPADIDLSMDYENDLLFANVKNAKYAAFTPDGYIEAGAEEGDFKLESVSNEGSYTLPWYDLSISGYASNYISLEKVNDGFIISGDNLTNVKVLANNDEIYAGTVFTSDCDSVLAYAIDDYTIGIKTDSNNDGIYDKILQSFSIKTGDVNCDGEIDVRDVTMLKQYIVKIADLDDTEMYMSDIISDNIIDVKDLGQLIKYVIKVIDKF